MKETAYIGVTGATTTKEVKHLTKTFSDNNITLNGNHLPMVGILASFKTLNGQKVDNRRYPDVKSLTQLFQETNNSTFNTIHYNTQDKHTLYEQLRHLLERGGLYSEKLCQGVQLNVINPPLDQVQKLYGHFHDLKIILQLSKKTFEDKSLDQVINYVHNYNEAIKYVLIDPSGGAGRSFKEEAVSGYYIALQEAFPDISVGVSGGFSGDNILLRGKNLISIFGTRDFSTDAEGELRDKVTTNYGDDIYNPQKVESYLKASAQLFN